MFLLIAWGLPALLLWTIFDEIQRERHWRSRQLRQQALLVHAPSAGPPEAGPVGADARYGTDTNPAR